MTQYTEDGNRVTGKADISVDGATFSLDVLTPVKGSPALDIAELGKAGYNFYDPGYTHTAPCKSAITFVDGANGILLYRGYPVQDIVHNYSFLETAYLVIYGEFPTESQLQEFRESVAKIDIATTPAIAEMFRAFPAGTHPMAIISSVISAISGMSADALSASPETAERMGLSLIGAAPLLVANAFSASQGRPAPELASTGDYVADFLRMCFAGTENQRYTDPLVLSALETLLILHADHEQNCSTATLRLVGSAQANFLAGASAAVCALWGPLHGGANQAVIQMLTQINADGGDTGKYVAKAKDPKDPFRLMGFGHRVYKTTDARAKVIRGLAVDLIEKIAGGDPLLDIAFQLEEVALKDDFFVSRHLYPNVDFYSGIIYRAIGFPADMFTPLFVLGRVPGWVAHWREAMHDSNKRIGRPTQFYVGSATRQVPRAGGGN